MSNKPIDEQIWETVTALAGQLASTQSELTTLRTLLATYLPHAHWINPRGVAKLYADTTEDDIRAGLNGRIHDTDDRGHLLITGPIWDPPSTRPALRPHLLAAADQTRATRAHRVIRSTDEAARHIGVPPSTLTAAAFTNALRDDTNEPVELPLDEAGDYLWGHHHLTQLAVMIDDGSLDRHLQETVDNGTELGVDDI